MLNKMFGNNKLKSSRKVLTNRRSNRLMKSNNLSLSSSHADSCTKRVTSSNGSVKKSKCLHPKISSVAPTESCKSYSLTEQSQFIVGKPKDIAVHFGNFYGLRNGTRQEHYNDRRNNFHDERETAAIEKTRGACFTRQMMHKLEKTAGLKDYERQVSILLKQTVEPPNFSLNSFLSENSIPDRNRETSYYPLWYKEPQRIPLVFSNPIIHPNARRP